MEGKVSVYISESEIKKRIAEIGRQITDDYRETKRPLILIGILKGSVVFMSDLMRCIELPLTIDFMAASSYGKSTTSRGNVKILKDLNTDIQNADVIVVEDILDSGYTLSKVMELLKLRRPHSIKLCTLLNKPERHVVPINLDYCGFTIEDKFVVGLGLDYDEKYRNLPYVGILELQEEN